MNLKINSLISMPKHRKINFTSNFDFNYEQPPYFEEGLIFYSSGADLFKKQNSEENENFYPDNYDTFSHNDDYEADDTIAAGPLGHPYTGRPVSIDQKAKATLLDWLLSSKEERAGLEMPALIKLFSLGDNNFDDDISAYHARIASSAKDAAIGLFKNGGTIDIPIGDINNDGTVDRIISGVNRAIDITGDGKADIIGTLIDIDGDGKADFVLDQMGKMVSLAGKTAEVMGDSKINVDDIVQIPKIVLSLLK